jgi:hypothetical protein
MKDHLGGTVIKTPMGRFPIVASPEEVVALLHKTGRSVRNDCASGTIPTLQRGRGDGAHWRIPVARLLDALGVPYEFEVAEGVGS